jgi:hypothetical protein
LLFIPLLLIRTGQSASASTETGASATSHTPPTPPRPHPPATERSTGHVGRHRSPGTSDPPAASTVAYDLTVSGTVPNAAPAHAADAPARPTPPPVPAPSAASPAAPPPRAENGPAEPATAPVTTTTLAPGAGPGTGEGVVTHGIVTYYDHPAGRCASPWIPFGTTVWITNPANGESVSCVVDDYETDTSRSVDLSTATFAEIAPLAQGVIDAELSW